MSFDSPSGNVATSRSHRVNDAVLQMNPNVHETVPSENAHKCSNHLFDDDSSTERGLLTKAKKNIFVMLFEQNGSGEPAY